MGTTYIKYPWETHQGDQITEQNTKDGQQMFNKVKVWCQDHAAGEYKLDSTIYAKGIKVNFKNTDDTKRLKSYMNAMQNFK